MAYAQPNIDVLPDTIMCDDNWDGFALFDLTNYNAMVLAGENPDNYSITFHETPDDAEENTNAISNPESYMNINANTQTIYVRVTETAGENNYETGQFNIIVSPAPETAQISLSIIDNDDENPNDGLVNVALETVLATIVASDSDPAFDIDFFTDQGLTMPAVFPYAVTTSATLYYRIQNTTTGCMSVSTIEITILPGDFATPAPTGEAEQTFIDGATLADLEVEGENIQWYETETGDTPLSMATVLVDNTTYYAAQSIDGVESTQRLAVTVNLTAGLDDITFNNLKYYPNPVAGMITLEITNGIDKISIANALGQAVMKQIVNNNSAQVDVSSLSNGVYFVTITSGSASKTIKIIKE